MPEGVNINPAPVNFPTPPVIPWKIIAAVILVLILIVAGVILAPRLQKKATPIPQNQAQNLSPLPPKVVCKRFTNLDEALKNIDIACVLDLSNQNLATVSADINQLTKLSELSLKGNNLTEFPPVLLGMNSLSNIDLSNNKIADSSLDISKLTNLNTLKLKGNPLSSQTLSKLNRMFSTVAIDF